MGGVFCRVVHAGVVVYHSVYRINNTIGTPIIIAHRPRRFIIMTLSVFDKLKSGVTTTTAKDKEYFIICGNQNYN